MASCVCLWLAAWRVYVEAKFISESISRVGQVVATSKDKSRPTVQFTDTTGHVLKFTLTSSIAFHSYEVGQQVPIRFGATDSSRTKLDSPLFLWESAGVFAYMTLMFGAFGLLTLSGKFVWGPLRQRRIVVGIN